LLTLAGAIFVSVSSEFLPTGLLPDMAKDLGVSISTTGLLVTIFAATVVVATTPLAAITRNVSRKALVILVLLVIALANVLAALAPTYEILVGARVLGGLAHGLFWAVVAAYSAHLVPPQQLGKAIAITGGGGSAAFVLGIPVGTALGHAFGWRMAFIVFAVIVAVLALLVVKFLPAVDHRVPLHTGEIALPARKDRTLPLVLALCAVIIVIIGGQNVFYTYIAPWLTDVAGFADDATPVLLFLYGGGGVIGLLIAGFAYDRYPRRAFTIVVAAVPVSLVVLALSTSVPPVAVVALLLWSVAFGAINPMLQTRMLRYSSVRMRDLAAALQTTAFNTAIGGGALVGGRLLDSAGLRSLPWAEIIIVLVGLAGSIALDAWLSRRVRRGTGQSSLA
jgi:predicted MFS family arabinose efflux permease